jgi:TolA-binding protein
MCANRVEELESRVQELEASVEGLTDELIECKVRIRELESATDAELDFAPTETTAPESPEESDSADSTKPEADDEADKAGESEAEIIVA